MEIEVLDVKSYKLCAFSGKEDVEEYLWKIKGCRLDANVSRPFDVLARYSDASSVAV